MSKKNSNDTSWDRTSDLPTCTTAQDDGKVVRLTHRPPLPPGNVPFY